MEMKILINKKRNKEGIFFSLSVFAILSIFFLTYYIYSISESSNSLEKRVVTLNNFVHSLEKDLRRQLYISGYRIIFAFEKKIIESCKEITDLNKTVEEAFFNGTIDEENYDDILWTFDEIVENMREKAKKINANLTISNPKIRISQKDPWNVKVELEINFVVKDLKKTVYWNKTENFSTYISIENFEDPLYLLKTDCKITNRINKTIYRPFVDGNDVTNLTKHLENSLYINSTLAPSFLDRLQGKTTSSEYGIESLIYLPELSEQGLEVKNKSVVDYIYFSSSNPSYHQIQGMPSWFRLDDDHLSIYGVEGLVIS